MVLATATELARTYHPPGYSDPWECVTDYQQVLEYTATHPSLGSSAVSSRLNLPRSRIRPWMNGSRPDVVRGIQTAEAHGWLAAHATPDTERALVQLAVWALSGGSIACGESTHVYFSLDHDDGTFEQIADIAGIDYDVVNANTEGRATEARPTTDGAVLARVLIAMGVPATATVKQTATTLPAFVSECSDSQRAAFARIYALNRGATHSDKATLTIREQRPESYLQQLAAPFETVTGEQATQSENTVTVSAAAARSLTNAPQ